jgi:hypothetical protein
MKQFVLSDAEVSRLTRRIILAGLGFSSCITVALVAFLLFWLRSDEPASIRVFLPVVLGFIVLDATLWFALVRPVLRLRKYGGSLLVGGNALSAELTGRVREIPLKSIERAVFHVDGFDTERIALFVQGERPLELRGFDDMNGLAKALAAELSPSIVERNRKSS